jgi:hypothetical protein
MLQRSHSVSNNQQRAELEPPAQLGLPRSMHAPHPPIMGLQRSRSVSHNYPMAELAQPAQLGVPRSMNAPHQPIMGLQRSVSVDLTAPHTIQQFTPEENQFLLAALEAYQAKLDAPSNKVSFEMQQTLMRKLRTGSMSAKPRKPRTRGTHGKRSGLSTRHNAQNKATSNSTKSSFPGLNRLSSSENAIEMRF